MNGEDEDTRDESTTKGNPGDGDDRGRGQAIQINENTIDDPEPPTADPGDSRFHGRRDVKKRKQALQINENTIADKE